MTFFSDCSFCSNEVHVVPSEWLLRVEGDFTIVTNTVEFAHFIPYREPIVLIMYTLLVPFELVNILALYAY